MRADHRGQEPCPEPCPELRNLTYGNCTQTTSAARIDDKIPVNGELRNRRSGVRISPGA
jgi:hypothetical protein